MYKRIVVKIGTKVITENGVLSEQAVERIVDQVAALRKKDIEVVVVTSGAVATGASRVSLTRAHDVQARISVLAAVGQIGLMSLYERLFGERGFQCAQILVTKGDFRDREHYANMKNSFANLLGEKIIPIVNENDAISIGKLGFTDNDELGGLIASQLNVDAVLFLTGVDGVLKDGAVVPEIREEDTVAFEKEVRDTKSDGGRGGMLTKFAIARRLMAHGITVHIVNGKKDQSVIGVVEGKALGTRFVPTKKISAVKRRLAYSEGLAAGTVYVDKGAEKILLAKESASLLPVGIRKIEGDFKKGETIEIRNEGGKKLGFGIAQYDAETAAPLLGKKGAKALVHYNYLVID